MIAAERAAILPPAPARSAAPTLPPAAVDAGDLAARAAHRAADCLDALADLREATIEAALRSDGRPLQRDAELSIGLALAMAVGALLALSRLTSALDAEAWAAIVARNIEGPEEDRGLAERLRGWAAARPTDPAPPSEARGG